MRARPVNPASCASAEELLLCELAQALTTDDVATARQLMLDTKFKTIDAQERMDALWPVIFECSENGHASSVSLLIDLGVSVNVQLSDDGSTPLHVAAKQAHASVAERLLLARADPEARMRHNITPLLFACEQAAGLDVARMLLAHRASADAQRDRGGTPLAAAASWGHVEIIKLLLEAGASVDGPPAELPAELPVEPPAEPPAQPPSERERLVAKAKATAKATAKAMAEAKARAEPPPAASAASGSSSSASRGQQDSPASLAPSPPAHATPTPLWSSCAQGRAEAARLLLEAKADVNRSMLLRASTSGCGVDTGTPLHAAAGKGHTELVRNLLLHGATPEACKRDGNTPLSLAARAGQPGVVALLLRAGARDGQPPGSLSALEAALEAGQEAARRQTANGGDRHAICAELLRRGPNKPKLHTGITASLERGGQGPKYPPGLDHGGITSKTAPPVHPDPVYFYAQES